MRPRVIEAGLLLLFACGPRATQSSQTSPATSDAAAADDATSDTDAGVRAEVIAARGTGESAPATDVEVRWTNPSDDDVIVGKYRVEWPGGAKEIEPEHMILHPRETSLRTVRVDTSSGDLSSLDSARAHVVVVAATIRPTGMPADEEPEVCRLLDSPDLPTRSDAARRITRAHSLMMEGGSEQMMEAAAEYCDRAHGIRPSWWSARR